MFNIKILAKPLFFLLICFSFSTFATDDNTATFTLELWAPDEVPPHDAKHAEIGNSYYYRYTPEAITFDSNENREVKIKFHESVESRYQFRWVTATNPGDLTLNKKTDGVIKIAIDDGDDVADEMYLEVWVFDTVTGERFMCDPQWHNRPPV